MLRCEQLSRTFPGPDGRIQGLDAVDLEVRRGEFVTVRGPSGSGKSTLLLTLAGMLRPTSGRVWAGEDDLYALPAARRDAWRARTVGFVFQLFHLLPYLSVRDNIRAGLVGREARPDELDALLERLGLAHRRNQPAHRLSAGERQRVGLARALVKRPELLLADEPTGNLDPDNAALVWAQLRDFQTAGGTVLVVTHDAPDAALPAGRSLQLRAGRLAQPG